MLAGLSLLPCSGWCVLSFLPWLYYSDCPLWLSCPCSYSLYPVQAVLSRLTYPGWFVGPTCPDWPFLAVLSQFSFPRCSVQTVLPWVLCHDCPFMVVLSQISSPCCHVLATCLLFLSDCTFPAVLSLLFCPGMMSYLSYSSPAILSPAPLPPTLRPALTAMLWPYSPICPIADLSWLSRNFFK
jgi:hypothetical protein